jgi:hypothetical protein
MGMHLNNPGKASAQAISDCSPYVRGYVLEVGIHEMLHAASMCGGAEGEHADCIHMSINIATADLVCDRAKELKDCLSDPSCPAEGDDPGTTAEVQQMLNGICDSYSKAQARHNSPEGKQTAANCACGSYVPATPQCPDIPLPPGGCPPPDPVDPGADYPIQDCPSCGGP